MTQETEIEIQARAIAAEHSAGLDDFEMWGLEAALVSQALALAELHRDEPDILARCARANRDLVRFRQSAMVA